MLVLHSIVLVVLSRPTSTPLAACTPAALQRRPVTHVVTRRHRAKYTCAYIAEISPYPVFAAFIRRDGVARSHNIASGLQLETPMRYRILLVPARFEAIQSSIWNGRRPRCLLMQPFSPKPQAEAYNRRVGEMIHNRVLQADD